MHVFGDKSSNLASPFFPFKADNNFITRGGSSSSCSSSSTYGAHGTTLIKSISFLSHSAIFCTYCSLLISMEKSATSTYEPLPYVS